MGDKEQRCTEPRREIPQGELQSAWWRKTPPSQAGTFKMSAQRDVRIPVGRYSAEVGLPFFLFLTWSIH